MSLFGNIFKAPKIRQYHHEYIYYNPDKEEMEERRKRVREELKQEKSGAPALLQRGVFQKQRKTGTASARFSNMKTAFWVFLAFVLCYIVCNKL